MSVSSSLKQIVEEYSRDIRRENELLRQARDGKIRRETVARYVVGLRHSVAASPRHLRAAMETATRHGNEPLAAFMRHKLDEEDGHHLWADADLAQLNSEQHLRPEAPSVAKPITALVEYLTELVARDPEAYVGYIFFVEYFTVLMGPVWLSALEERCGIPRAAVTVVDKHVELDVGHVEEGCAAADSLLTASSYPRAKAVMRTTMSHYDAFFADLAEFNDDVTPHQPSA